MRNFVVCALAIFVCAVAEGQSTNAAAPSLAASKTRVKCTVCAGRGYLKVRPPDHGQFGGRIEHRSHWDVKLNPCPICQRGRGWRTVWDISQPEPQEYAPCMKCGWSGLVQCRRCLASGMMDCPGRECKDGWVITNAGHSRRSRTPVKVEPCQECKGVGKIVCRFCKGLRAELCSRCFGEGKKRK